MLVDHLRHFFLNHGLDKNYFIAYSGGMDSHVLLSAACELRALYPISLNAVHVNHGLSQKSNFWALHCEKICKAMQVPLTVQKINICIVKGDSIEELARKKRYEIFASLLTTQDILLTAHQQDDQAETLLLQLLRGAGLKGLASMPEVKTLGKGKLVRPLLDISHAVLEDYANAKQLKWIEDESNDNTQLTRNFLRLQVLPLLKTRWPTVTKTLARTAKHMKEAEDLLSHHALQALHTNQGTIVGTLSVTKLQSTTPAMQRLLLRTWIAHAGFPLPSTKKLSHIQKDILLCRPDKTPLVKWQGTEVRRYRNDLYLLPPQAMVLFSSLNWELSDVLDVPEVGTLKTVPCLGGITNNIQSVLVRFRQGGEVVRLGKSKRHPLKKLFQTLGVPPWERNRIPLIYDGEELIAAVGYYIAPHVCVAQNELGFGLELQKAPS